MLAGVAAGCVSLLGEGSSMAVAGAATLAQAVARDPSGIAGALRRYEDVHRRRIARHRRGATAVGHVLVPATRAGLGMRNGAFRLWSAVTGGLG